MLIKSADFVISNSSVDKCPNHSMPEYAFIGRSNVGKSTLINYITNKKSLAKTSGKPGKTQLINHFLINQNWYLVDLPGYGYARVSKSDKNTFQKFITDYFLNRKQLVSAFVLIDIRHEPQKIDLNFMQWLGEKQIPFAIVFTKADKLKPQAINRNIAHYSDTMLQSWESMPDYFITSATKKIGRNELLNYINLTNANIKLGDN